MLFESVNLKENKILKSYANHIHMMPIRLSDQRSSCRTSVGPYPLDTHII